LPRRGGLHRRRDERGTSAVEYAILVSLIAAVIAGSVGLLGDIVLQLFDDEALISALSP